MLSNSEFCQSLPSPGDGMNLDDFMASLKSQIEGDVVFVPCEECQSRGGCSGKCGENCTGTRVDLSAIEEESI